MNIHFQRRRVSMQRTLRPKLLVVQLRDDGGGTQLTAVKAGAHDLQNGPYGSACMQVCALSCGCVPLHAGMYAWIHLYVRACIGHDEDEDDHDAADDDGW